MPVAPSAWKTSPRPPGQAGARGCGLCAPGLHAFSSPAIRKSSAASCFPSLAYHKIHQASTITKFHGFMDSASDCRRIHSLPPPRQKRKEPVDYHDTGHFQNQYNPYYYIIIFDFTLLLKYFASVHTLKKNDILNQTRWQPNRLPPRKREDFA